MTNQVSPNATIDSAQRGSLSHFKDVTLSVMKAYVSAKGYAELVAQNYDSAPVVRSYKKVPESIEFCVDVETATEYGARIGGDAALERTWFKLACGEPVELHLAKQIFLRCGRVYEQRRLLPWQYFKRDRYAHRRPR